MPGVGLRQRPSFRREAARTVLNGEPVPAPVTAAPNGHELAPPQVEAVLAEPGEPLDVGIRAFMEAQFGADFGRVRIHAGPAAALSARAIAADAYTFGADIVFAAGRYAPQTGRGRHLIAHELAHVEQQRAARGEAVQRAPARTGKVPTLSAARTTRFFSDLNTVLKAVLPESAATLSLADFLIKPPAQYAAYIWRSAALSGEYTTAKAEANSICGAVTAAAVGRACGTDKQCPAEIRRVRGNARLCRGTIATDELVSHFISTRGVTPAGGGPSVVAAETTQNKMLLSIVHDGVHRMRGKIWQQRSKIGAGYTHSRTGSRLAHIGHDLDEGAVQILTDRVIGALQNVRGRRWFTGYTSTAYVNEVRKVRKMLADHGKNIAFLKRAYVADTSAADVEDLQAWQ